MPSALGQAPEEFDQEGYIAGLMDVVDRAFQYADEAANGAQRALSRSSTRNEERLETVMHAAHAHWLVAERHHGRAREAHADGQRSRLEHHASEAISAAVETQRAAGVATTADALREVLDGLKPATERARQAEVREQLAAELDKLKAERDRELTAVTRMDAANRDRLRGAQWRAESAVPALGWWPTLAADMEHAYQGRLWLDETGAPRLLRKTADGRFVPGRKVDADRVAMLRAAGFLVTGTDGDTSTPLRPSDMGREALYLATLHPAGLHEDARAAYEARYEQSRRPWMKNEERKSAARRLPPLDRYAMRAVREKPVLLEDDQVPQISTEDVARHADMAELAQRLGRWAAMSQGEKFDVIQAPSTAGAQEPEASAGDLGQDDVGGGERTAAAPSSELPPAPGQNAPPARTTSSTTTHNQASEGTPLTADSPAAMRLFNPAVETDVPPPHKPTGGTTASSATTALADDWTLDLPDLGAPHSEETAAAAWAMRGVLADYALIDLMAALDDDDAFARWKSWHVRQSGEGTGHVNKALAPGASVSHRHSAKHFEARIADHTVNVTWDLIRTWLREATTPEAVSLLQAAEEAGARLLGGRHGDSLLAATGELAPARDLRVRVKRLTGQVLDHVVQFMATMPLPTGRRGKPSARAAAGASLFDLNEAPVFDLPGADQVRVDLDNLIAYLPDPRADREPQTVPLSALRAGMVLDRGDMPVVITEIIRHTERCDIVGEFRGPIWPARIKHSVELSDRDSDPLIPLASVLPSLYELTGRQPELGDDETLGPLVEGHPARSAPAGPRPPAAADGPLAPPVRRLPDLVWDEQRRRVHGQTLADLSGERPPLSAKRRELDPDDPYAQFTDNLGHQLQQLADHPDEQAAVASAARDIRETVSDVAARARKYSTERLRAAESSPAELLQLALEPSRTDPFVRIAMNAIMGAIDMAEDAVTSARAKARVRAALTATVCSSPPREPQGDSPRDFGDVLVEFEAVASNEQDTVAELLAGPAQWAHFAKLAADAEAATATPDPNPPAARFANVDELRAHLADLTVRPLPDTGVDSAGLSRHELRARAKYAGQLASNPTLELTPSRRLAIHGSAGDGWHVVAPGSADAIVPWPVKSRRHALRYAALLEKLTDAKGNAYPWDADEFPSTRMPYEPLGGHLLYDYVKSNQSHQSLGFHHHLRVLTERSQAYGWMRQLSLYRFSGFDYIHPASPSDLQPGDEVMFTFDQDELTYAQSVAGYFPPPRVDNLAIGTAVVGENHELIPGFWWPERHPEQSHRLTQPVALRDGARRPRPGEYTLHAGITAHLPELTAHQTLATTPQPAPAAPAGPRAENGPAPAHVSPTQRLNQEPGDAAAEPEGWSGDASSALAEAASVASGDDEVPATLLESPGALDGPAPESAAAPVAQDSAVLGGPASATSPAPAPAVTGEEAEARATDVEARWREVRARNVAAGEVLGIDLSAGESFEGYAGRFDSDYDITLPSGRYCYRTPGFTRKQYSVRYIPDPTRDWESEQIGTVSRERDIMPMVRRHAAEHADQRDPHTVELNEHEQKALHDVARGTVSRSLGEWYRHNPEGRGIAPTDERRTHALWTLSALGLIQMPPVHPDRPADRFARLSALGEQRHRALRGEPDTHLPQPGVHEQTALFSEPASDPAPLPAADTARTEGPEAEPEVRNVRSPQWKTAKGVQADEPASDPVVESPALDQSAAGTEATDADDGAAAKATGPAHDGTAAERGTAAPTTTSDRNRTQQADRRDQAAQAHPGAGEETLDQRTRTRTDDDGPENPRASGPDAPIETKAAPVPPIPMAAPAEVTRAVPDPAPHDRAREDIPGASALLAETAPAGTDEDSDTERDAPTVKAAAAPGDRPENAAAESEIRQQPRPSAAREEGTVATSAPPNTVAAEEPVAPDQNAPRETRLGPETAAPYRDAAAYAAAHEALLTELDQHEQWLARTPAAAEAATTLADTGALGVDGLTALLALQAALAEGTDKRGQRTPLKQRLGFHIRCAQLTMAKRLLGQAARTSSQATLRDLYQKAYQGQFIALVQQTEDGEMELGQYIQHRAQQPLGTEDPAEQVPETAEEAVTMAVDPDDDSLLPVFELPGESLMTAAEAAPRLLAQAQAHLAGGNSGVSLLAHLHGRPVYTMIDQAGTAPVLLLGLAAVDEGGSTRAVSIPAADLAKVSPEVLLQAVVAWMNASDDGARPLLDYAPSAPAPTPEPSASDPRLPTPAEVEQPAPAAAPAARTTAPPATEPQNPRESLDLPVSAAPGTATAPEPASQTSSDVAAEQPAGEAPATPDSSAEEQPEAPPVSSASAQANSAARPHRDQRREQHDAPQAQTTSAEQPVPAQADLVDQLTALARSALTDLGVALEATGVLTADHTVVITLETSGSAEHDREIADNLRRALHEVIRQHPDQGLAAYRVDFEHTPQVGQGALQGATMAQRTGVPRERLIAANRAAAQLFTDRLQGDPNAELARTYLTRERHLPAEVQQEWGLGYAPSDRGAGRWDLMVRELTAQGFTEDELLHAGLASRSKRDTLIDAFADRIMFPIHDEHGDIVGFSGRRIERPGETKEQAKKRQSQKYYNTSNHADLFSKSDLLFGLHHPAQAQSLAGSSGPRVSVEGYFDVIAVARAAATLPLDQRPVAGAPMGADISERQLTVLRGLDTDNPRPHIMFLDADDSGHKVLLTKSNELLRAPGPTEVTTAPGAKDAAKLWEEGIEADRDGATPVLRALEQRQPLLDAIVEAVLLKNADERERADHAFDSAKFFPRTRAIAAEAARYIHQAAQLQSPGDTTALEQAALTWAKRLDQEWKIPGHTTATAVMLGPGKHHDDYENAVYQQSLDLLAADPEGYFANDSHVRSRQSAAEAPSVPVPTSLDSAGPDAARPGQWPAGTRVSSPTAPTSQPINEPAPKRGKLALSMSLPSPVDGKPVVEHTDRTTAAYALHTAVHERLGQHTTESPEPDRLPQPLKLGTVHDVDLSTSGDDQTSDDPTVVVWLGPSRSDSLRMSYSRIVEMTAPELLAAIEWRAAQAAGLLGTPLSQTWRDAVRSILPSQFPAQPTPAQLADLLDTIALGPDSSDERIRHRAERALALYTAGHPDLALNVLAADDHIWVLRNDGSWIQEETVGTELSWEELDNGFSQETAELDDIAQAAAALPPGNPVPMPADLTVAHHSAHEALAALHPYSIGLPNTLYEKITDLVAQMDANEPALRRLHGPDGEQLMNRAKRSFIRILEGLATVASKIRLTDLSNRLERTVARLRGQDPDNQPAPRAVRTDRRMQDLAHIERDLERRMAAPTTTLDERGELQEQWIINRARWRARYEQLLDQPPGSDFLPDNGLIAGAPPIPNLTAAHERLLNGLSARVNELRDVDPHTGEGTNPDDPTADLFNGVAWAYQQRLVGIVPTGDDPQGHIDPAQLRQAALTVTSHQNASPLTLRRTMNVTAERADRLLHRLEEQQILGPFRADAPRSVLVRPADIDMFLARPATPTDPRTPPAAPAAGPTTAGPEPDPTDFEKAASGIDEALVRERVLKIMADHQEKRGKTRGEPAPAEAAVPAPRMRKNPRKTAHKEAEANALAAGQSTSLAPSQF